MDQWLAELEHQFVTLTFNFHRLFAFIVDAIFAVYSATFFLFFFFALFLSSNQLTNKPQIFDDEQRIQIARCIWHRWKNLKKSKSIQLSIDRLKSLKYCETVPTAKNWQWKSISAPPPHPPIVTGGRGGGGGGGGGSPKESSRVNKCWRASVGSKHWPLPNSNQWIQWIQQEWRLLQYAAGRSRCSIYLKINEALALYDDGDVDDATAYTQPSGNETCKQTAAVYHNCAVSQTSVNSAFRTISLLLLFWHDERIVKYPRCGWFDWLWINQMVMKHNPMRFSRF